MVEKKVILKFDMPKFCMQCPLAVFACYEESSNWHYICGWTEHDIDEYSKVRNTDCPLKTEKGE